MTPERKLDALLNYVQHDLNVSLKHYDGKYLGLCPAHEEKSPSFNIYPHSSRFYCYGGCGGGDVLDLYRLINGGDFLEAKKALGFWDDSPTYKPPKALPGRQRKGQIELTDSNKKEVYLACRQAMIDRKTLEVIKDGRHYAYDFEFVWECIDGQMKYVWKLVYEMGEGAGDEFFNYVWLKIGEEYEYK